MNILIFNQASLPRKESRRKPLNDFSLILPSQPLSVSHARGPLTDEDIAANAALLAAAAAAAAANAAASPGATAVATAAAIAAALRAAASAAAEVAAAKDVLAGADAATAAALADLDPVSGKEGEGTPVMGVSAGGATAKGAPSATNQSAAALLDGKERVRQTHLLSQELIHVQVLCL